MVHNIFDEFYNVSLRMMKHFERNKNNAVQGNRIHGSYTVDSSFAILGQQLWPFSAENRTV